MPLLFFILVLAIIGFSAWLFLAHPAWLPVLAAAHGRFTDQGLTFNLILLGVIFVLAQLALGAFAWRYRARGDAALGLPRARFEWLATIAAGLLFLGLNAYGSYTWAEHGYMGKSAAANPIRVEVTGQQFAWYFRYPGEDDEFGRTDVHLQDASVGNPLGLVREDARAKDDVVVSTLVLPVDADIELTMRAQDVIHSFFVPELRLKQDAVPGMSNTVHFHTTRVGDYELACAELCGTGHYRMKARVRVLEQAEFARWLAAQEPGR